MKRCPTCGSTYTDDTLAYCLQDGATLQSAGDATNPLNLAATMRDDVRAHQDEAPPTERMNFSSAPTAQGPHGGAMPTALYQEARPTERITNPEAAPPTQTSQTTQAAPNTTRVILFTIIATVLLVGLGGVGAWMMFRGSRTGPNSNTRRVAPVDQNVTNESQSSATPAAANSPTANSGRGAAANARGASSSGEDQPGKGGRWFVVLGSFPKAETSRATERLDSVRRKGFEARMVSSDDYPNMKSGLWVIVMGPYTRNKAEEILKQARPVVTDAYTKSGW